MAHNTQRYKVTILISLLLPPPSANATVQQPTQQSAQARVRALLVRGLPVWSPTFLAFAQPGSDWAKELTVTQVLAAMQDRHQVPQDLPRNIGQLRLGETTVRVEPRLGRIRYINGDRVFKADTIGRSRGRPFDSDRAQAVVLDALRGLGLPQAELDTPTVQTQMAVSGPITSRIPTDTVEMYRIVAISRRINGIRVYDSRVLASVNDSGEIQRLLTVWPPFRFGSERTVRERNAVIDEALGQILRQSPRGEVSLDAHLVYAPRGRDDGNVEYVLSVAIAVDARPTAYVVVVPVVR
jgi:hypothetical protein